MINLGLKRRWAGRDGAVERAAEALRKRGRPPPLTPKMIHALKALQAGQTLDLEETDVGRPTKQRLAKYGFAEYLTPKDWDGPMRITTKGLRAIGC